jgi:hypothetical protein
MAPWPRVARVGRKSRKGRCLLTPGLRRSSWFGSSTIVLAVCLISATAAGQETGQPVGAGPVEIAAVPGGGTFFMKSSNGTEPKFGNYTLATSVVGNVNRWIGIEG